MLLEFCFFFDRMDRDSENQNLNKLHEDNVDPEGNISESESVGQWNPQSAPNIRIQTPAALLDSDEQSKRQHDQHGLDSGTHQTYGTNYNVPTQFPKPGASYGW